MKPFKKRRDRHQAIQNKSTPLRAAVQREVVKNKMGNCTYFQGNWGPIQEHLTDERLACRGGYFGNWRVYMEKSST